MTIVLRINEAYEDLFFTEMLALKRGLLPVTCASLQTLLNCVVVEEEAIQQHVEGLKKFDNGKILIETTWAILNKYKDEIEGVEQVITGSPTSFLKSETGRYLEDFLDEFKLYYHRAFTLDRTTSKWYLASGLVEADHDYWTDLPVEVLVCSGASLIREVHDVDSVQFQPRKGALLIRRKGPAKCYRIHLEGEGAQLTRWQIGAEKVLSQVSAVIFENGREVYRLTYLRGCYSATCYHDAAVVDNLVHIRDNLAVSYYYGSFPSPLWAEDTPGPLAHLDWADLPDTIEFSKGALDTFFIQKDEFHTGCNKYYEPPVVHKEKKSRRYWFFGEAVFEVCQTLNAIEGYQLVRFWIYEVVLEIVTKRHPYVSERTCQTITGAVLVALSLCPTETGRSKKAEKQIYSLFLRDFVRNLSRSKVVKANWAKCIALVE